MRKAWAARVRFVHGATFEDLAAGDVMLWREAEPGADVFVIGPLAHIGANLSQNGLRKGIALVDRINVARSGHR
jgi:hypothetical protein